jgi:hypothetical protein
MPGRDGIGGRWPRVMLVSRYSLALRGLDPDHGRMTFSHRKGAFALAL